MRRSMTCPGPPANTTIYMHHFQLRDEDLTRRRLEALCEAGTVGTVRNALNDEKFGGSSISKRFRSLDAAYRQEWAAVENSERTGSPLGVNPIPWRDAFPADDVDVPVWYSRAEFDAAVDAWRAGPAQTRTADG